VFRKRQKFFVPPESGAASGDFIFADLFPNPGQIVRDLQGRKTLLTKRDWLVAPRRLTFPAFQLVSQLRAHVSPQKKLTACVQKTKPAAGAAGFMIAFRRKLYEPACPV
jgi:hypothetical protein